MLLQKNMQITPARKQITPSRQVTINGLEILGARMYTAQVPSFATELIIVIPRTPPLPEKCAAISDVVRG